MLPNREGRFKATIADHGVAETGPNNLATFVCQYKPVAELVNGEWADVDEDFEISGYHYLEKKDGSINQVTIDSLKAAFGWDGRDPFWLQDADLSGLLVQVKLGFEEYEGKQRIKVQFVDAEDATPRDVPKADDNSRRSITTRLGAKFRALAGGSPAPAPKPSAARPTLPAKPAPATRPTSTAGSNASAPASGSGSNPPTGTAPEATMEQAWAEFTKHCLDRDGKPLTQEQTEAEWFAVLAQLFPGKQPADLSAADWAMMRDEGPNHITPF
ncbi:MAG: hypothetical protein BIFFINMI_03810 [Phycisphaerae bacterium]|nr:hypothetical protein [Phycisphaerae bacterium]